MMDAPIAAIIQHCVPSAKPEWLVPLMQVESGLNPYAIRLNSGNTPIEQPKTKAEAIALATQLMTEGADIDLGLGGIRVNELAQHGLTVAQVFELCANIKATALILQGYYGKAQLAGLKDNDALSYMYAAYYGAGDAALGRAAEYDARVMAQYARVKDVLTDVRLAPSPRALPARIGSHKPVLAHAEPAPVAVKPAQAPETRQVSLSASQTSPRWDVYGSSAPSTLLVFSKTTGY